MPRRDRFGVLLAGSARFQRAAFDILSNKRSIRQDGELTTLAPGRVRPTGGQDACAPQQRDREGERRPKLLGASVLFMAPAGF